MTCRRCQQQNIKKFGTYGPRRTQRYRCQSCHTTFSEIERPFEGRYTNLEKANQVVSLMVEGPAALAEGMLGALTLRQREELWCEAIPIRIARLRNWLQPAGSRVEIGAELRLSSEAQIRCWQHCLLRLGIAAE